MNKEFKLNELGKVNRGKSKHRPRNDPILYGGKYPFIQTGDVKHSPFYVTTHSVTYNEKGLAQSKLWPKGTLCITIAANIAETAILSYPACFPDSIIGFIPDSQIANVKFIKYCIDTYKLQMQSISQGTTQDNLSIDKLLSINFSIPVLSQQKKIAAILSTYDDLIENNKRRITLLEKIAEEIYHEWFVRFRFPGYKNTTIEKGIPEGWELGVADNFFGHVKGKSYSSDEVSDDPNESMPFINLKSFHRGGRYREDGLKYYSGKYNTKQIVREGDVVMAVTDMTQNREVVGRVARIPDIGEKGAIISLDVVKLVPKSISTTFLYSYLKYSGFGDFIKSFANGANVLHLKPDLVTQQKIVVPPEELRLKFEKIVEPIFIKINLLSKSNRVLELSRSHLLPRLISGKISVEHLNIQMPPSMLENIDE
ncbi:restriction endonuclease subunit S [Legionella pneumophila]|uniref:restriction endonuclease subunit S n=1 Tax=Legionella pneumophila TaxID=446 RepID=UPI00101E317E|nr:restriction endonuclease subunit S [Legionella pneumophila]RYW88285.1 restriction endonuclease subunit S [Legionella pneumophila]